MMILLNGHSLSARDKFQPERMSLQLSERNSSATMNLSQAAPTIAVGDWLRSEDGPAAGIVWRVRSVETQLETSTTIVQLEHAINTLRDVIMFGETDPGTTSAEGTARFILGKQSDWILGSFGFSMHQPFKFNGDDLFSALETVSSTLDDCLWDYSFSSYPFTLNIRKLDGSVTAEMRSDRNIRTLRKVVDRSRMYTRFYPIGKNDLHITGNYVSKNEGTYGTICKTETDSSKETESELLAWANTRLNKHCQPTVTVTISGIDLSSATGESLDNFEIGKLCRIPLPEFNTTITDRVSKLSYQDVISSPTDVTVTLSNERTDTRDIATVIQQEIKEVVSRSGRSGAKNSKEDHAWMVDTTDHIGLIAEAVAGEGADKDWSRVASIMLDGNGIHQRVTYTENGLVAAEASIEITENQINQTVQAIGKDGKVTAASIVAAINRGSSEVLINADHIRLTGNTTVAGLLSVSGGDLIVSKNICAGLGSGNYIQGGTLRLVGSSSSQGANVQTLTASDISEMIIKADVSGNTLRMWRHGDSPTGTPSITFSRAVASWDLGWSSGTFTAKANPQNQSATTTIEQGTTSWDDKTVTIWINARNSDHPSESVSTGRYVQATYSGGGSDYPYTKTLRCTGATFSQSQWVYTFRYTSSSSGLFVNGNDYKFHHNSGYT